MKFLLKSTKSKSNATDLESKAPMIVLSDNETNDDDFELRSASTFNFTNSQRGGDKTASMAQAAPANAGK